jgi:lycopene beta-cyclase
MNTREVDLVILGGGCAGLSLARELSFLENKGETIPRTLILESKASPFTSKTWCMWQAVGQKTVIPVAGKWNEWSFSTGEKHSRHTSPDYEYVCVRGEDFFGQALDAISRSESIHLQNGTSVGSVDHSGARFLIRLPDRNIVSKHIVDTRPPDPASMAKSLLFQSFAGYEVTTQGKSVATAKVGLMESMEADELGFRFDYCLPLESDRMLVEATRFSAAPLSESQLLRDLRGSLARILPDGNFKIHRREFGIIPMGLSQPAKPANPDYVLAGTAGGAVRPASGYAFADIQKWATSCAHHLFRYRVPVQQRGVSGILRRMDLLFLSVLLRDPGLAPELFISMADTLSPGCFVRFMTGNPRLKDLLAVVRSLPAGPFLREIEHQLSVPGSFGPKPLLSQ